MTRRDRIINAAKAKMNQIARQLLQESKAAVTAKGGFAEKGSLRGRDLLSLLTRANMAEDIPEYQKLKDEDVLAREFRVCTIAQAG